MSVGGRPKACATELASTKGSAIETATTTKTVAPNSAAPPARETSRRGEKRGRDRERDDGRGGVREQQADGADEDRAPPRQRTWKVLGREQQDEQRDRRIGAERNLVAEDAVELARDEDAGTVRRRYGGGRIDDEEHERHRDEDRHRQRQEGHELARVHLRRERRRDDDVERQHHAEHDARPRIVRPRRRGDHEQGKRDQGDEADLEAAPPRLAQHEEAADPIEEEPQGHIGAAAARRDFDDLAGLDLRRGAGEEAIEGVRRHQDRGDRERPPQRAGRDRDGGGRPAQRRRGVGLPAHDAVALIFRPRAGRGRRAPARRRGSAPNAGPRPRP